MCMNIPGTTKILIVDDHELIREGLKKVIRRQADLQVVGEARSAPEVFEILRTKSADVALLDISLPGASGLDLLRDLRERAPKMKVLILSVHPEERFAVRAIRAGASGYLTKEAPAEDLVRAIRRIAGGGKYVSPALAEQLASEVASPTSRPVHEILSNREFEVMRMIASGKSVNGIAEDLALSIHTVATYKSRIMHKMGFKGSTDIVRYALENKLID